MSKVKVRVPFVFTKSRPHKSRVKYNRKPKHKKDFNNDWPIKFRYYTISPAASSVVLAILTYWVSGV